MSSQPAQSTAQDDTILLPPVPSTAASASDDEATRLDKDKQESSRLAYIAGLNANRPASTIAPTLRRTRPQYLSDRLTGRETTGRLPQTTHLLNPSSDRQGLGDGLYTGIMESFMSATNPDESDTLTEEYSKAIGESPSFDQRNASTTLLAASQGAVAANLDTWIQSFNKAYADETKQAEHEHATYAPLEIDGEPDFDVSKDGSLILVTLPLNAVGACSLCEPGKSVRLTQYGLDVVLKLELDEAKRTWSVTSDPADDMWRVEADTD